MEPPMIIEWSSEDRLFFEQNCPSGGKSSMYTDELLNEETIK